MNTTTHRLREWRHRHRITLAVLADRASVTPSHLSEIENRKNVPSLGLAAALSALTSGEVSLADFVVPTPDHNFTLNELPQSTSA
jgi:transcriptional regulator with XRE-family HTH domain